LSNEQLIYGVDRLGDEPQSNHTIAFADPYSGKTLRTISLPGLIGGTPAVHGDCLFVKDEGEPQGDNLQLNCIDLNSGEIVWFVRGNGYAEESQIGFYNGQIFDVFYDQLFAIDERSGTLVWKSPRSDHEKIVNPQVVDDLGWIALETLDTGKVIFMDLETGKRQDEVLLDLLSSPIFIGHEAIYGITNAVVRVDIVTGKTIWSIPVDSHYFTEEYNNTD
jgi:outer membrane protein assembly factor BamB